MLPLVAAAAAAEEVWFVPDEALAGALREAVAEEWPEVDHEVRIGEAPADLEAVRWDGRTLALVSDEGREGEAGDPHVAALLARTWVIRPDNPSFERWAPTPALAHDVATIGRPPRGGSSGGGADAWALAASVGTRSGIGEPGLGQGLRVVQSATMGAVLWTADVYVGIATDERTQANGWFASDERINDVRFDRATFGTALGLRGQGRVFTQATLGIERRTIDHVLDRGGMGSSSYQTNDLAIPVRAGLGLRSGRLVPTVGAWARVTPGLPFTAGGELDLGFVWARERLGPVGDGGTEG